ncbi:hypothetical protein ELS24_10475 [Achromobacter spanius]|uniref:hypothetical protein n=1 Tax=Achromobacter spanius TaxID=217203 RepID=UPI000F8F9C34|nr:hypothetical protein [Achromobacter spanius]AZS78832.1 hypothetical protein ELS24_10475 [Achromobacter spanius]
MIQRLKLALKAAAYILRHGAAGADAPAMTVFRVRAEGGAWSSWSSDPRTVHAAIDAGAQHEYRELFVLPPRGVIPVVGRVIDGGVRLNQHGKKLPSGTALFGTPYPATREEKETHDFMESKVRGKSA